MSGSDDLSTRIARILRADRSASWIPDLCELIRTERAAAIASRDGYVSAFYDVAQLLGIGARASSPADVWATEMLPMLRVLLNNSVAAYAQGVAEERERAARVADGHAAHANRLALEQPSDARIAYGIAAEKIAIAIRAGETGDD